MPQNIQAGSSVSAAPKIIDIPNLGRVEFQGSMSDDQISEAIRKHQSAEPGNHGFLTSAQHAVAEWWNQVNPAKAVQGMADVAAHPLEAVKAYGAANSQLADKAKQAFKNGDYGEGLRHSLGYLLNGLPGIGSTIDEAGDKAQAGDIPGALGETAGFATMALPPELGAKVPIRAAVSKVAQPAAERLYQSALKPSTAKGAAMNETDSKLLRLQPALDRAVARINNHDMLGLGTPVVAGAGAAVAGGPGAAAAALFKHVLDNPEMKSQLALAIAAGSRRLGRPIPFPTAMARVTAFAKGFEPQPRQSPDLQPVLAQ